ncbi:MAG: cell division protein FtsA [Elusimicrobiota bacterium]
MGKQNLICALDIGSSKLVAILGRIDPATGALSVVGSSEVNCRGARGGVVVNIPEAARAITQAVELCEEKLQDKDSDAIDNVIVMARGNHLQSFNNKGAYNIARTDKEITSGDVDSVLEIAQAVPISHDREVLHAMPQDFWVDRQKGVPNPVGMEGSLLEVDVHILTATSSHLNNLTKAVNQAGFRTQQIIYGIFALGETVVTMEEREQGCLLIDFGGEAISLGVYSEGSLRYSKEIHMGMDTLTRDLAYYMRTSLSHAGRIKEQHGACLTSLVTADEDIEYFGIDGREIKRIKKKTLVEVIQPRVEEMFTLIHKDLETAGWLDTIVPGGIILTGGGSLLRGLTEASMELMGVPSRLGLPQLEDFESPNEIVLNPTYATAIAGLHFFRRPPLWGDRSFSGGRGSTDAIIGRKSRNGVGRKIRDFIEELFS